MCGLRSLRDFEVRWKMPSWDIQKQKSFQFRGAPTPDHGLCSGPRWEVRPRPPSVPSAPKLPLHHWPAFVSDPHPHRVVVRRVWRGFVLNFRLLHLICWLIGTDMCKRRDCLNNYCTKYYTSHNSRGADSGPRAPPLGLIPMHILLYPRDCSYRKIMLTGKNLGYRVFTSRLFK